MAVGPCPPVAEGQGGGRSPVWGARQVLRALRGESFYHQGVCRGSQSACILPPPHPLCLARGPLTCAPGLGACVLRAPSSSPPSPTSELGSGPLSLPTLQTRAWTGAFSPPTCLMLTQLRPLPPPSSCWEGGPGTWEPSSWALWPWAAVPPVLQVRPQGPGPLGPPSTSSLQVPATSSFLSTEHLVISIALTPRFAQVGVDRPGCWSL